MSSGGGWFVIGAAVFWFALPWIPPLRSLSDRTWPSWARDRPGLFHVYRGVLCGVLLAVGLAAVT